jgi:hypothetical protein
VFSEKISLSEVQGAREIDRIKRTCVWLVALLLVNCSAVYQSEWFTAPQQSTITGRVVLEGGRGFDDVEATLSWYGEQEDEVSWALELSGRGEFRAEDLLPGDYHLEIAKPRFDPYSYRFSLGEEERIFLEVELQRYSIPDRIGAVSVVGDFIDWETEKAVPLEDDDGDGLWETAIPLPPGRYSYKYIINGLEEWFIDIDSRVYEPDGYGSFNSVVEIAEAGLVTFHLDTNDAWYRRTLFQQTDAAGKTGWVIWEPEEPRKGQEIAILYDARGGPLEGAQLLLLHWGVNDWTVPDPVPEGAAKVGDGRAMQTPMEVLSEEIWWVVIPTGQDDEAVDFAFTDGQRWDNNEDRDWHVPILSFGQPDSLRETE